MAGDHLCGYVRDSAASIVTKHTSQKLGFMYGLMVVVERLVHVGISTHTAGKSNTKEDLPRKFLLPQKVQHNVTDLINLCCDTSGPEEKYITETETKNKVSTFVPTRLGGHGWRPCVWQCCRHCHKTYKHKLGGLAPKISFATKSTTQSDRFDKPWL